MFHQEAQVPQQFGGDLPVDLVVLGHQQPAPFQRRGFGFPAFGGGFVRRQAAAQAVVEGGAEERFAQKAPDAGSAGFGFDLAAVIGRDQQQRQLVAQRVPQAAGGLDAVHAGHLPVQQHGLIALAFGGAGGGHLDGRRAGVGSLCPDPQAVQLLQGALAQVLVVVHHQHPPGGQLQVGLLAAGAGQVQRDMEGTALALAAVHLDPALHGVHDILGDGHAQAGALDLLHPGVVLPGEGIKDMALEFLRHADAGVLHKEMAADPVRPGGAGLLVQRDGDAPGLGGELDRVGQQVEQHLIEPDIVAQDPLGRDVPDHHVKILPLGLDQRLDDADQRLHRFPQRDRRDVEGEPAAFDLGHVQHVVDEPQQVPAGQVDLAQAVLHPVRVVQVGGGDAGHPHNGVEGGADVMAHVGQELAFGLVGPLGFGLGLAQRPHLPAGQLPVAEEGDAQRGQQQRTAAQCDHGAPLPKAGDDLVQRAVGHDGDEGPVGIRQGGAVDVPAHPLHPHDRRVILPGFHRLAQRLGGLGAGAGVKGAAGTKPVVVVVGVQVGVDQHQIPVAPHDVGEDQRAALLQFQRFVEGDQRQRRHQGRTLPLDV